jgi:hypothetical protein
MKEINNASFIRPDINVELTKIHIFSEHTHERLSTSITTIYAFFVGFLALFFTFYYSNIIPLFGFILAITVFIAGTVYETIHVRSLYEKNINKISEMIEIVKESKELPSLKDLINQR